MPCYSPPPPFAGEERRSAEQAARLLCEMVADTFRKGGTVSRDLLEWWVTHRRIDAKIAKCEGGDCRPGSDGYLRHLREASEADADVEMAQRLLDTQQCETIMIPSPSEAAG